MALLPEKPTSQTVEAIYSFWAGKQSAPRAYLGGSVIGRECERQLWYGFRWATGGERFEGRMLRLFDRGQREEAVLVADLRAIGCEVYDIDPATGSQFNFKAIGGHAGGSMDAAVLGVPEAPKTYHVAEFKTHNSKSFATLLKDGVEKAKPEHYAQMQIYMHWSQLTRALYLAVNKDTDELYSERVRYDETFAKALEAKAERVIYGAEPPQGISEDPSFFKCKFCPASKVCHTAQLPQVSCRTCAHATPEPDGDGRWSCAKWKSDIPLDAQRTGCPEHRYIPALLKRWGEATDASEAENWIEYTAPDGVVFRNGPRGPGSYGSAELAAMSPAMLRDSLANSIRDEFDGRFVPVEEAKAA
ncbi:hypothetical protein [Luteibacter sp. E-22]|uniref:hypothetical protein n=1 Tax=Luteibacter sp. E-22 TaxID=3404050 RepID=UPI003CEA00F5